MSSVEYFPRRLKTGPTSGTSIYFMYETRMRFGAMRLALGILVMMGASTATVYAQEGTKGADQPPLPSTDAEQDSQIVVRGRRSSRVSPLDKAIPRKTISGAVLSTYGAKSLGELLQRLKRNEGGAEPSIVVNGRRLGSIADLEALPAEVLDSIEMYDTDVGQRFGFRPSGARVFNLVLKQRFRSLDINAEASTTTDGGRESGKMGLNGARLRGDHRLNMTLSVAEEGALRAGQLPAFGADGETGRTGEADRSLLPAARSINATIGMSLPLGSDMLDLSATLSANRISSLLARDAAGEIPSSLQPRRQRTNGDVQTLSATYSVTRGAWFGSLIGNISRTASHNLTHLRSVGEPVSCDEKLGTCKSQDIMSVRTAASVVVQAGGPFLDLPAGQARIDLNVGHDHSFAADMDRLANERSTYRYRSSRAQLFLSLPLVDPEMPVFGTLNRLDVSPSLTFESVAGTGRVFGKAMTVNWMPSSTLSFNSMLEDRGGLPSSKQLNAPQLIVPGVNVFDYRAGGLVVADQLTGGTPLSSEKFRMVTASATYTRQSKAILSSVRLVYFHTRTDRPAVSLFEPSPLLEDQFPDRFVRDGKGALTLVDARPFNAFQSLSSSLSGSLDLSGTLHGTQLANPRSASEDIGMAPTASSPSPLQWRLGLRGDYMMKQALRLTRRGTAIDLIAHPLSVSGTPPSRWNVSVQGGIASRHTGFDLTYTWRSGARSEAQSGSSGIRSEPLNIFDLTAFYNFKDGGVLGLNQRAVRVTVAVRNMFNARPKVTTFTQVGASRLNPWILSPEGRVVTLSLTVPIIDMQ